MTRKNKPQRISIRKATEKPLRQAWMHSDDHGKLPSLAEAIKAAHPGREVRNVSDVLHFCVEAGEKALGLQGA